MSRPTHKKHFDKLNEIMFKIRLTETIPKDLVFLNPDIILMSSESPCLFFLFTQMYRDTTNKPLSKTCEKFSPSLEYFVHKLSIVFYYM